MSISRSLGDQQQVDLSAGPLLYREVGQGPTIVFVHGVFVNGDLWRKVVPELATSYRCITPDWPLGSHDLPMRRDADLSTPGLARLVAEFLEALDLSDVTLVGNDTGGAVCQLVMADHRARLGPTVLTSCDAFETFPPSPFGFLRLLPRIPGASAMVSNSLRLRPMRKLPIAYGRLMRQQPEQEISDSYARPATRAEIRYDGAKVCLGIDPAQTIGAAERLRDFPHPVLLAWSGEDLLFPTGLADRLAAVLPHATRVTIPGARTFSAEDRPHELATAITSFLAGAAAG